jgi:hypothetical protein
MIIEVRWVGRKYAELTLVHGGYQINTGLLNEAERKQMSIELEQASKDLMGGSDG